MRTLFIAIISSTFFASGDYTQRTINPDRFINQNISEKKYETGIRSGQVIDAATGKPIEDAVVTYTWNVRTLSGGNHKFETKTDNNGKYIIPNQKITTVGESSLESEHVYIYKNGYIGYEVDKNKTHCFIEYIPNMKLEYRKEGNIAKMQPWNEKLLHREHMNYFDRGTPYVGPKLDEALEIEKDIALQEDRKSDQIKQKFYDDRSKLGNIINEYKQKKITKEEYTQKLYEYLKWDNPDIVLSAAQSLNEIKDNNGVGPLIQSLKKNIYREAFKNLLFEISMITDRRDLNPMTRIENIEAVSKRNEIIKDLEEWWGRNKDSGKTEQIVDLFLNAKDDKAKWDALSRLQNNKDKSGVPSLIKILNDENTDDRMSEVILQVLSKAGDKSAIPAIKTKMYHPDIYVRRQAAVALNKLGDNSGIAIMIQSLDSRSTNSRSIANAALKEMTGQDFTEGKSLRQLSDFEEKTAIGKWKNWWRANKDPSTINRQELFKAMAGEETAIRKRYNEMEERERNNPELPKFASVAKTPKVTFEKFRAALLRHDTKTALSLMSLPLQEKYEKIFEQIGIHLEDYAKGLGKIHFDSKVGDILYYEMVTEQDDGMFSFPIHFAPDEKGNWIIIEF